jgi:hypothetical protein
MKLLSRQGSRIGMTLFLRTGTRRSVVRLLGGQLDRYSFVLEVTFQFWNTDNVEVKHGGGQQNRGAGLVGLAEVFKLAGAARRDDLGKPWRS